MIYKLLTIINYRWKEKNLSQTPRQNPNIGFSCTYFFYNYDRDLDLLVTPRYGELLRQKSKVQLRSFNFSWRTYFLWI